MPACCSTGSLHGSGQNPRLKNCGLPDRDSTPHLQIREACALSVHKIPFRVLPSQWPRSPGNWLRSPAGASVRGPQLRYQIIDLALMANHSVLVRLPCDASTRMLVPGPDGNCQMIRMSRGMIFHSGQSSGSPGRDLKRYRQFLLMTTPHAPKSRNVQKDDEVGLVSDMPRNTFNNPLRSRRESQLRLESLPRRRDRPTTTPDNGIERCHRYAQRRTQAHRERRLARARVAGNVDPMPHGLAA